MSRRYFLSPVVGTGTRADPFRLKVGQYATISYASVIPSNPDGTPKFTWGLAILNATDQTTALADNTMAALPDKTLDQQITAAERNAINAGLTKLGIASFTVATGDTIRSVLARLFTELGLVWTDSGLLT